MNRFACAALICAFGCSPADPQGDESAAGSTGGDPTPYLGTWSLAGTVTTTCSDGTSGSQALVGTVSITRGTGSSLLRTVTGGSCPSFQLSVGASSAKLVANVQCPTDPASQLTLTSWQVTLGADATSATESGSAKTVFLAPATGTCSSIYSTSLLK